MITNFSEWKNKHAKKVIGLKGYIHSIDSFRTTDGPGIRFLIFMQGCSLQCKYCHNRDLWFNNIGKEYTTDELIFEVMKYKNYFDLSSGGVTISGGEALLQKEFVNEFFFKAKQNGIHTCLDTSGYIDICDFELMMKNIDLTILDIKHMDDNTHKWLTGVSNEKIMKLALFLNETKQPTWIRHVLIPGISDNIKHLNELGNFLNKLNNVERFEFLRYHSMGKFKWNQLGIPYELEHIRDATAEDIERANQILNNITDRHL